MQNVETLMRETNGAIVDAAVYADRAKAVADTLCVTYFEDNFNMDDPVGRALYSWGYETVDTLAHIVAEYVAITQEKIKKADEILAEALRIMKEQRRDGDDNSDN